MRRLFLTAWAALTVGCAPATNPGVREDEVVLGMTAPLPGPPAARGPAHPGGFRRAGLHGTGLFHLPRLPRRGRAARRPLRRVRGGTARGRFLPERRFREGGALRASAGGRARRRLARRRRALRGAGARTGHPRPSPPRVAGGGARALLDHGPRGAAPAGAGFPTATAGGLFL